MAPARQSKAVPCQECRNRHLKCDGSKPTCQRCKRAGATCVWGVLQIRFRHGSSARHDTDFPLDQTWIKSPTCADYTYVDETAEIASYYTLDPDRSASTPSGELNSDETFVRNRQDAPASASSSDETEPSSFNQCLSSSSKRQCNDALPYRPYLSPDDVISTCSISPTLSQHIQLSPPPRNYTSLPKSDASLSLQPHFDAQEACLMRYFIVELAHYFDLCDGARHFATVIPSRARTCSPLLYAIYTASARHLSRIRKFYNGNCVQYAGKPLPNLTPETAVFYHNKCIDYLMSLSDNPQDAKDENLLAAAVILRYYEEVDVSYIGEDSESALRGIQVFLDAQTMSPLIGIGVAYAAYWVALRQEVLTAFSKQRPFRLRLDPCDSLRSFGSADDYVWANRLVIHCADVLQYCFGIDEDIPHHSPDPSQASPVEANAGIHHPLTRTYEPVAASDMTSMRRIARYEELIAFDALWTELHPASFDPIYVHEPDYSRCEVFPELWYFNDCHVAGIQHLEIARILLAVHNPKIPRLGLGHRVAMQKLDQELRTIVVRLCGIGLANQHSPPGMVTAGVAIAVCGDRFTDRTEQKALLAVLVELEEEHGWPTQSTQKNLKDAWAWSNASS